MRSVQEEVNDKQQKCTLDGVLVGHRFPERFQEEEIDLCASYRCVRWFSRVHSAGSGPHVHYGAHSHCDGVRCGRDEVVEQFVASWIQSLG